MPVPKIYHPFRKYMLRHIIYSSAVGYGLAECYWRFYAQPKIDRRDFVMKLMLEEEALKRQSMDEAEAELDLPAIGSLEDLLEG